MATRQLEVVSTPARAASVARQDRRMYRRYDLSLPLTVRRADIGRAVEGRTRDLSSRGVYFLAEDVFVPGCRIDLTVSIIRARSWWPAGGSCASTAVPAATARDWSGWPR